MSSYVLDTPKVLVADDDEATRILLRSALTQWGYSVVEARDGEEAWRILTQPQPPEILTLDWIMPKLDGVSLCKRINTELTFHPYIIFLTRMTGAENVMQGLDAGADEFIIKPVDLPELRIRVFAGERIIRYRRQLGELNLLLQEYALRMKPYEQELAKMKQVLPQLQSELREINDALLSQQQTVSLQVVQDKLKNTLNLVGQLSATFIETDKVPDVQIQLKVASSPINNIEHTMKASEASKPTRESIVDLDRLKAFFGDDVSQIKDFIETFIALSTEQVVELQNAIQTKDAKLVKYYFHLMGSASGNSGMVKMYDICGKGEEKAMRLDWPGVNQCYADLKIFIEKLKSELASDFKP